MLHFSRGRLAAISRGYIPGGCGGLRIWAARAVAVLASFRCARRFKVPRYFTPHCLRHTYASLLLQEDGGRLLYVSRQLGHANVTITADTYAKWFRPVGRGVVNTLAVSSVV
jgi:integrase